jgi:hypothetical protein
VRCMDPDADLEMLQAMESEIRSELSGSEGRERLLKKLQDSFSTSIQLSPLTGCLAESPPAEADLLAKHYLETSAARRVKTERGAGARLKIAGQMRRSFEDAGVWELMMKKIAASEYTAMGDPLKIDCGYKPNGTVRMFHAVSLQTGADHAKTLAYSYPLIQAGIQRKLSAKSELTAVVEDGLDRGVAEIAFGIAVLERSQILVAASSELSKIAERARQELKA